MKQQVLSFLSTIKDEILDINEFLYNTNENTFNEFKAYTHITNKLKKYGFLIEDNFCGINTAFKATIGKQAPEICFICKYSTGSSDGHIYGNNSNATISIGAAIGLASIIDKLSGSISIIGCPGKYSNGSEIIMTKEKVFDQYSIIFAPHVDNVTSLINTSVSCSSLEIKYRNMHANQDINISSLDFCLHTIHFINQLIEDTNSKAYMDHLCLICDNAENEYPTTAKATFQIKAHNYKICELIEGNIRKYINCLKEIMNISTSIHISQLPCKELIENNIINKLFEGNLKQSGIINISHNKNTLYPLAIGTVSHSTPTIYPSISIVEDCHISCPSIQFRDLTISTYAKKNIWKSIEALVLTSIDFLERPDLILESTATLANQLKYNK